MTSKFGLVDILVSVAGDGKATTIDSASSEDWNRVVALNLSAPFYRIKLVAPRMRNSGGDSIVKVGSFAAFQMSFNNGASEAASACTGTHALVDGSLHVGAQYDDEPYFAKRKAR